MRGSRRNLVSLADINLETNFWEAEMPDASATADYFQDQADRTRDPRRRAHYQHCADTYRAQVSEADLSQTMQRLTDAADVLRTRSNGQINRAKQRLLRARRIVTQQQRLIERRRSQGLDTVASEVLLRTFERSLANFEDRLGGLIGDLRL